jgi:hypothetical protein
VDRGIKKGRRVARGEKEEGGRYKGIEQEERGRGRYKE